MIGLLKLLVLLNIVAIIILSDIVLVVIITDKESPIRKFFVNLIDRIRR